MKLSIQISYRWKNQHEPLEYSDWVFETEWKNLFLGCYVSFSSDIIITLLAFDLVKSQPKNPKKIKKNKKNNNKDKMGRAQKKKPRRSPTRFASWPEIKNWRVVRDPTKFHASFRSSSLSAQSLGRFLEIILTRF